MDLKDKNNISIMIFYTLQLLWLPKHGICKMTMQGQVSFDASLAFFYESKDTRETNSNVIRPLDLVLMTKCSGYFLNNISRPYHGFPLDSGPGQSSDVRYLLTRLWCQTLLNCSTNCNKKGKESKQSCKLLRFKNPKNGIQQMRGEKNEGKSKQNSLSKH